VRSGESKQLNLSTPTTGTRAPRLSSFSKTFIIIVITIVVCDVIGRQLQVSKEKWQISNQPENSAQMRVVKELFRNFFAKKNFIFSYMQLKFKPYYFRKYQHLKLCKYEKK
jgi:hypothetical protein